MTRFKRLLALMLVFTGAFAIAGCTPADDGPTDLEQLAEALLQVDLADEASSDLTFPSTGLHDVVITWESSDTSVIANDGTVTIPTFTEGDQVVTITASLTLGDDTLTKTFEVTVLAATVKTDVEKLAEAKIALLIPVTGLVLSDITLPETALEADVTWVSSNTDVITNDGVVTRPLNGEGNADVVLTATLTLGDETTTKTFDVTVREEEPSNVFTSIPAMHETSILGDIVEFQGIVVGIFDGGYFLSDGTYSLGVYNPSTTLGVEIGDEVYVKGSYAVYNTLFQINGVTEETNVSSGNANPLTAATLTVAELLALDSSNPLIHGMYYQISGTIELRGDYDNIYIVDGDDAVMIYYSSLESSLDALVAEVGKEVTITVIYYTNHATNGVMVVFDGGTDDIDISTLSDVDALTADLDAVGIAVPDVTLDSIILPTSGPNGTVYTDWVSDNTAIIANNGTFVAVGDATTTVTFTATATKGTETGTATVEVVVPILSTVGEVVGMSAGDFFEVTGTVYEEMYYGFYIHADGKYAFVYDKDLLDFVEPGQEITILGFLGEYSGLLQLNVVSYTLGATGGAVPSAIPSTVGELEFDLIPRGTLVTVTGTVSIEGTYNNVFITGPGGGKVQVYYRSNASEIAFVNDNGTPNDDSDDFNDGLDGEIITLILIGYQNGTVLFQGVAADIVTETAFTDAQKAADAAASIDLGEIGAVESDLTLPVDNTMAGATITWATSDPAVITTAGVVTRILGADTPVTLTATVTVGVEVVTRDIVITVLDANDSVPMSVTEALALTDGDSVLVVGVITGMYYDERVIQGPDGAAIWVDSSIGGEIGDQVVVRGTLSSYTSYGNNERQLDNATLIETLSTGNALVVNAETDPEVIVTEFGQMGVYTATLTVDSFDTHGYVFFDTGEEAMKLKFSYSYYAPYFEDVYAIGDTVEVTFTILDVDYDNVRMVNISLPTLTEAQNMLAVKGALDVSTPVTGDLTLETALADYNATIVWASTNEVAITTAGVVTRPANGVGDTAVTLTATVTIGTLVENVVFNVVVSEELPPSIPGIYISEYIEGSGNNKALELYNSTADSITLNGYVLNYYNNGATDVTQTLDLSIYTIAAGDVLVICTDAIDAGTALETNCDVQFGYPSVVHFNGDDAITLTMDDVVVDIIGVVGEDPGTNWVVGTGATSEYTLVRDPSVTGGNTTFTPSEWIVYPQNTYDYIGAHTQN